MNKSFNFYYSIDLPKLYRAYENAIKYLFKKNSSTQDPRILSFPLDFSLKYNMNGGTCNVVFSSLDFNSTRVEIKYSVLQASGARCKAHADDLINQVAQILQRPNPNSDCNQEDTMKGNNMKFCTKCGKEIMEEAIICPHCGCVCTNNFYQAPISYDEVNIGLCILSFLFPLFGIIYWPIKHSESPKKAQACGIAAIISWVLRFFFGFFLGLLAL